MNEPAIAVAVKLPDGEQRFLERGMAVFEHDVPTSSLTVFNVGSVAKQFTAHLVLLAARAGALGLKDEARHHLPRLTVPGVTIAQLLTHTSGLRDTEAMLSLCGYRELDHYTTDDLLNLAYRQHNRAVQPDAFLYSNTNYLVLAKILEIVHGGDFADLAQEKIFGPLSMTATGFRVDPRVVIPNAAASYERDHGLISHAGRQVALAGSGSLWTNPRDLLTWLTELHTTWAREEQRLPFEPCTPYTPCDGAGHLYGPGLFARTAGSRSVFHNGHEHGFSASTYVSHEGLAIACTSNAAWTRAERIATAIVGNPEADLHSVVAMAAADETNSVSVTRQPPSSSRPIELLGHYTTPDLPGTIRIGRVDGKPVLLRRGTADVLSAKDDSELAYEGPGLAVTFPRPPTKSIPDSFVLNLDRAPAIVYQLTGRA